MTLRQKIEGISAKVRQLIAENKRISSENEQLRGELKKLNATISQNEEMVASLKLQLGKTQNALNQKQANSPEESKQLRKKVDKYIEELDKCIDWLENT